MENWYDTNKCLEKARLFVLCMKETPLMTNSPENKCKKIFDKWSKCIIDSTKDEMHRNYTLKKI